jgi:hypothetical protein
MQKYTRRTLLSSSLATAAVDRSGADRANSGHGDRERQDSAEDTRQRRRFSLGAHCRTARQPGRSSQRGTVDRGDRSVAPLDDQEFRKKAKSDCGKWRLARLKLWDRTVTAIIT